jgi:hypothetical protein
VLSWDLIAIVALWMSFLGNCWRFSVNAMVSQGESSLYALA